MKKDRKMKILVGTMIAVLVVLGGTTVSGYMRASKYKMNLNYNYQRAMRDLTDSVDNIETTLNKSIYANTATQQNGFAAKLMRETSLAKASLAVLPLETGTLNNVGKYITQVGDFSMAISSKVSSGQKITQKEYDSMQSLQKYAQKLKGSLQDADMNVDAESIAPSFNTTAEDFTNYPSLIYDGPFSDHIGQREPKLLKGLAKILQGNAQNAAAEFLGVTPNQLVHTQDTEGGLPTYNFTIGTIRISVTKTGGIISSFIDARKINMQTLDTEAAKKIAVGFLNAKGIKGMRESYYVINDGICTINYEYKKEGVICYPDLIKVAVGLDNGSIVQYNATGYIMNHMNRETIRPVISEQQAKDSISSLLKVKKSGLAIIPTPGLNEVLCYEFVCSGKDNDRVLVYVNAKTGLEEQILIVINSDQGVLAQ